MPNCGLARICIFCNCCFCLRAKLRKVTESSHNVALCVRACNGKMKRSRPGPLPCSVECVCVCMLRAHMRGALLMVYSYSLSGDVLLHPFSHFVSFLSARNAELVFNLGVPYGVYFLFL